MLSSGSFLVSPFSNRVFSSSITSPSFSAAALALASSPATSAAMMTSLPSSSLMRFATIFRLSSGFHSPLGLPMWEQRMTFALWSTRYLMVGMAATIRLSEVMTPFLVGTLKSQRHRTRLPATSMSSMDFLL